MASKGKYHLVPEDAGRPSIDTISDDQPLIRPSVDTLPALRSSPKETTIGFEALHPTLLFRALAFTLQLTGLCLLAVNLNHRWYWRSTDDAVSSILFLSFALARNAYVVLVALLGRCVTVDVSLSFSGVGKGSKLPRWLQGKVVPVAVDVMLLVCLIIVLPIGIDRSINRYHGNQELAGYSLGLVGMALHTLGAFDCGKPSSIAFKALLTFKGKQKRDVPGTPVEPYSDVEAQLPGNADEI